MVENKFMTVKEVAEVLQLSESKIKQLCQNGDMPSFKVGSVWRIDPVDLHDYIDSLKNSKTGS